MSEEPKIPTTTTASSVKSFLSGGFGGMASVMVGQPFDLVKVRLQTTEGVYKNTFDCFRKIVAKDGLTGLYRGMATPLASVTPIFAVSFFSYDLGKKIMFSLKTDDSKTLTLAEITAAGAFSAVPTTLFMAPSERVKVLMQVQGQGQGVQYKGPLDVVRQLYKEGGVRSIFRGTGATLLRDSPGSAAYFVAYELVKKALTPEGTRPEDLNMGAVLFAGGMAGVAMWTIAIPPDVLKSRLQSAPAGTYTGLLDCLRKTVKTDGPRALFKGLGPAMLRAFPANAATFLGVEYSMQAMNYVF
ncbi:mitochondrial carrier domain-containing protein [Spinellus fusiger]|nr:mitochondrial carrier domain-containing protein [Spinellus fusiger]